MSMCRASAALAVLAAFAVSATAQNFGIELVGSWNQDPNTYADVWGEGDLAFVAKFGSPWILILDVSDPTAPSLVSRYDVPPPSNNSAQDVKTAGGLMFVGLESGNNAGAQIVDIRDPSQPSHLVDITVYSHVHNLFYADGWLYLASSSTNGFAVIDLRAFDPDNPPATITTPTWWVRNVGNRFVHDITVQGSRLYANGWDGMRMSTICAPALLPDSSPTNIRPPAVLTSCALLLLGCGTS